MRGDKKDTDRRTRLLDTALAVVIAVAVTAAAVVASAPDVLDLLLVAAGALVLAGHRVAPRAVLAVTTLCMLGYVVHAHPGSWAAFPVLAAVHAAARGGHRAWGVAAGALFLAGYFTVLAIGAPGIRETVERSLLLLGWFLCAGVTGLIDKNWQAYLRQTEQRALDAERSRDEAALRRAGEERLRIARELHDSLTHSISIVKLQAGVAVHLARKRGTGVEPALLAIQEASGEAMRELRATLEVLRTDVVEPGTGLDRIDELAERARTAGIVLDVTVSGDERPLPPAVDRAAYRIVQEALTNVARHAGRATTTVRLTYTERALTVRVDDQGPRTAHDTVTAGTGLTGMRERVTALGGVLEAAPRPAGGFSVCAELPLQTTGTLG
ncbi:MULTISPECIES: sensor histidine kinase [unclassified Streptomyces]|uniref:sensor histidine kinase n=1 Tax=unclassified Streptomyces TaxID=2593676 RepID=UPI00224F001E|nr:MULTISPECIES: sensor histidine kinase [unclassified Streptomyces]WSP58662.1 sensor histidine kinase [Streptomyces sp. NBC_01241]WSU20760.1 sensor histidine kinase [Streptomyces sp. NBC_01108]MCX4790441.1 sensor histidine kinase [Streptomyces sp. NBC_01221]MCX4793833.1 sensor histidine kinase [Streptomyces sp. NBC_01242]WSJ35250.1 sensor histidine kinase [Streptomyces sp. NBC_01321]